MATKLDKPVHRESAITYRSRNLIITIAPLGGQKESRIGFRLKGERVQYVVRVSQMYQLAALWHGNRELAAKKKARRDKVPWRLARKKFIAENTI